MEMTQDLQNAITALLQSIPSPVNDHADFVKDFKADPASKSASDDAWDRVIKSGVRRLYAPQGNYRFDRCIDNNMQQIEVYGDGGGITNFNSYVRDDDGMRMRGGNAIRLRDFSLNYKGSGQAAGKHGLRALDKVLADSIRIDGFTGSGIFTDSIDGTIGGAAFFSHWLNVWSKGNGGDGFAHRFGANGHLIQLGQFDRNKGRGYHHYIDGGSTYNTVIQCSQACYNSDIGWMLESGTNITTDGLYAEFNGSPKNSNSDGYVNTNFDYFIGDKCSRSRVGIGTVYGNDNSHVRAPKKGLNDSCGVYVGADRLFATTVPGAVGSTAIHQVM